MRRPTPPKWKKAAPDGKELLTFPDVGQWPVGFTGTQSGMTEEQLAMVTNILLMLWHEGHISDFHHGDCIGSDEEAQMLVMNHLPLVMTHSHPGIGANSRPSRVDKRAYTLSTFIWDAMEHLARNCVIAARAKILIATPRTMQETLQSGTWHTVRVFTKISEAHRIARPIYIVRPDGRIDNSFVSTLSKYTISREEAQAWGFEEEYPLYE